MNQTISKSTLDNDHDLSIDGRYHAGVLKASPNSASSLLATETICGPEMHFRRTSIFEAQDELIFTVAKGKSFPEHTFQKHELEALKYPSFPLWSYTEDQMIVLMEHMIIQLGFVEPLNIDKQTLRRFLMTVRQNYNPNAYSIITIADVVDKLSPLEKFIVIISAISHENMHTCTAILLTKAILFHILAQPETNLLASFSKEDRAFAKKHIIKVIMATDLAVHKDFLTRNAEHFQNFDIQNDEQRQNVLLPMIMKCADISNEARPPEIADPWVDRLLKEFFNQGDLEKSMGLPCVALNDREQTNKAKAQTGFIEFVLLPLFQKLNQILPNIDENYIKPMKTSLEYYKKL